MGIHFNYTKLGYFVIDNVSIGGQATFSIADGDYQSKTTEFILMPTVAYYFPTKKMIRPFVALGADMQMFRWKACHLVVSTGQVELELHFF